MDAAVANLPQEPDYIRLVFFTVTPVAGVSRKLWEAPLDVLAVYSQLLGRQLRENLP